MASNATQTDIASPAQDYAALNANIRSCLLGATALTKLREIYPVVAVPLTSTIYVAGSGSTLPAGNDTTGTGSAAAPYATLTKALSTISTAGDVLILCDGTFAENSSGSWILAGSFTRPVVFDSYTQNTANFIITNASGSNGVIRGRGSAFDNIHIRRATIRSSTEGNSLFAHNPVSGTQVGSRLRFFDCIFEAKSHSTPYHAISLISDIGINTLHFVRCAFKRTAGASAIQNPSVVGMSSQTQAIGNQPHRDIGFWGCSTTDAQWNSFSFTFTGADLATFVGNTFSATLNHAFLIGTDTSDAATPKVTRAYVANNDLMAAGTNGHGLEIGANVIDAIATNNRVSSELQGIVVKGATGGLIEGNTVVVKPRAVNGQALYSKASVGVKFRNNAVSIDGSAYTSRAFLEGPDGSVKAGNTELTGNVFDVSGVNAVALVWSDATGSTGGAVSDYNTIALTSSATLGSVRGTAVTNAATLRAAWASSGLAGDVSTNDAYTSVA